MSKPLRVLIVEDSEDDAVLLLRELRRGGYELACERVETSDAMRAALEKQEWDIVISDYILPKFSGLAALAVLRESGLDLPFIIVSGNIGEDIAVGAMKAGAHDYIIKGNLARLVPAVERELRDAWGRREGRRAEETLRENERLLRTVLETLPVGVWIVDKTGKIVQGNPATRNIWAGARYVGFDRYGEYKGWWVGTGKQIQPEEWAAARAITKGETSIDEEIEIECFDGTHKIILNSAIPIRNERQEITSAIIVNQDITDRKRAEQALRENNELLENMFSTIHVKIAYMDTEFNFVRVNRTYAEADGKTPEYYPGKNHFILYPNEENEVLFRRVVETGEPYFAYEKPFEYTGHTERGVTYWDWSLVPIKEGDGRIIGVVLSLIDVTDRKLAEVDRDRLAAAVASTADAVVITEPVGGLIQYVNPAFERITGYARDEIEGRSLHVLDSGKQDAAFYQELRETLGRNGLWRGQLVNKKKDGTLYYEECTYSPVRDSSGKIINYVSVKRDVTERLRFESIAESVNTMENIGYVFSGVRHEIGNPINTAKM
jgi:phosphoserine phosphatase RsbU/P